MLLPGTKPSLERTGLGAGKFLQRDSLSIHQQGLFSGDTWVTLAFHRRQVGSCANWSSAVAPLLEVFGKGNRMAR